MARLDSIASLIQQLEALERIAPIFLGLFIWEIFTTIWFEFLLLCGRISFKWPYIPYLVGRYSTLAVLVLSVTTKIDPTNAMSCLIFGRVIVVLGDLSMAGASLNLMIRAVYVARLHRKFEMLSKALIAVGIGHGVVLLYGIVMMVFKFHYRDGLCEASTKLERQISIVYLYNVFYDFLAFVLMLSVVLKMDWKVSHLTKLLVRQGVGYFAVAFAANMLPAGFALYGRDELMLVITSIPGYTMSTIASGRSVTSLIAWNLEQNSTAPGVELPTVPRLATQLPLELPRPDSKPYLDHSELPSLSADNDCLKPPALYPLRSSRSRGRGSLPSTPRSPTPLWTTASITSSNDVAHGHESVSRASSGDLSSDSEPCTPSKEESQ